MRNRIPLLFAFGTCCASVVAAAPISTADLVSALVAGLSVGEPLRIGSLAVFPLVARSPLREPATRIVTIGEAMEHAWLTLRRQDLWAAPRVLMDSWADAAIFLAAGEELPGTAGLVLTRDVLAAPGVRGLSLPVSPAFPPAGPPAEMAVAVFPATCEGLLVAIGSQVVSVDLFPSAWFLARMKAGVLRRSARAALASRDQTGLDREDAEAFLLNLNDLAWTRREPVSLGLEVVGAGPGVEADALVLGGALVHLAVVTHEEHLLLGASEPQRP